jgi:hypothetical protein
VQTQHDGITLEIGSNRPIRILLVFLAIQIGVKLVDRTIHAPVPEHSPHTLFGKFHIDPIVPPVVQNAGQFRLQFTALDKLNQFRVGISLSPPDSQIRIIPGVVVMPV